MGIKGFEERLTNARKEKGYTQEELSVKLGVTPQAVSKWERGMGYPDLETLYHLSEILGCSLDYLLNKVQGREKLTEDGDELQRKLLLDKILAEPIVVEAGEGLIPLFEEESRSRFQSICELREKLATQYGVLLPIVRIKDNPEIDKFEYRISVFDKLVYSASAQGEAFTFIEICNSLEAVCIEQYDSIMNRQTVQILLDNVAERYPAVVKGVIPNKVSISLIQKVLTEILKKKGSIRNLVKIIELLEDQVQNTQDADELSKIIMNKL